MRFKEFLLHEGDAHSAKEAELNDAVRFFRENPSARDALKQGKIPMFRGKGGSTEDLLHGDSRSQIRRAAYTDNYINLFLTDSPSWEGFPKRNASFICSNMAGGTAGYGTSYAVFPADKAKVAICNAHDFWDAFVKTLGYDANVSSFNGMLARLAYDVPGEEGKKLNANDASQLRSSLRKMTKDFMEAESKKGADIDTRRQAGQYFLNYMEKFHTNNMEELMDKLFDTKVNNMAWAPAHDLSKIRRNDLHEMWVEGPAFFIRLGHNGEDYDKQRQKILDAVFK